MPAADFFAVHPAKDCGEETQGFSCACWRLQYSVLACFNCLHHLLHVLDLKVVRLVREVRLNTLNSLNSLIFQGFVVDEFKDCFGLEFHDFFCLSDFPRLLVEGVPGFLVPIPASGFIVI